MLQAKPITVDEANEIIAQLDAIADRLFLADNNFLGNQVQELAYLLSAQFDEEEA